MYLLSAHQNPVGLDIHKNNPNLDHFISHNYYYTDTYYLAVPLRTANLRTNHCTKLFLQTLLIYYVKTFIEKRLACFVKENGNFTFDF